MRHAQLLVIRVACAACPVAAMAFAQVVAPTASAATADAAVVRHVVAAGGGTSTGATYTIRGTIGQLDAEPLHPASSGAFALTGGFWTVAASTEAPGDTLFTNGFE